MSDANPPRRIPVRTVLAAAAALVAGVPLAVFAVAGFTGGDPWWALAVGGMLAALVATALIASGARFPLLAGCMAVTLAATALAYMLVGGVLLLPGALLLAIAAALPATARWRARRVAAVSTGLVATLALFVATVAVVDRLSEPERLRVRLTPSASADVFMDRTLDDPRVSSVGSSSSAAEPITIELRDGLSERDRNAFRGELLSDPRVRSVETG